MLIGFFLLTFAFAWLAWEAAAVMPSVGAPAYLLGTFAPGLIALALTARERGRSGVIELLSGIARWNVGARWYVFAASYMIAVKLVVAVIHKVGTGVWPRFGEESVLVMAASLLVSTWAQAGEELGWRAFALPRLARHVGLAGASVLLGVIWALWHLPLFFVSAADTYLQSFPVYLLQVTALSVAFAWLYWRTESLLLVMLLHAAINNTKGIVPSANAEQPGVFSLSASLVAWLTVAVLWIVAIALLLRMHRANADPLTKGDGSS